MDYFNLYKDVWNFHKKYMNISGTDAEYENLLKDSEELLKQYKNDSFVYDLISAIVKEIEKQAKNNNSK